MAIPRRILVTGAAGLIGGWVASELTALGCEVTAACHRTPYVPPPGMPAAGETVRLAIGDFEAVRAAVEACAAQAIVHAAALATTDAADERPLAAVDANVVGTANVLEAARVLGIGRVLVISSGSVYGWTPGDAAVLDEDRPFVHSSAGMYGATKLAGEVLTRAYRRLGVDAACVRTSRVFGAGPRRTAFLLDELVEQCLAGGPMLLGPSAAIGVDYTYVRDLAGAVAALLGAPALPHDTYNVSGGRAVSGFAVARTLQRLRPGVRWRRLDHDPGSTFPYARPRFSIGRIDADIGWTPQYPMERALADYLSRQSPG